MGLKLRLEWYDKKTEFCQGEESSEDLGEDDSILGALGTPVENNINNGGFNVGSHWIAIIQPHFQHCIVLANYDYQIAFDYSDTW
ncbi:cloacin [Pseudomonas sp. PB120]|uniref:colicin E3-like toxin immunity protein n=1 Tax=Pseudomonas sp. PB120 TaxID=2494700 RepID=UPI0012FD5ABC|nr:colicin E3-like toxin immunity protein [Pseudomonas sp. PB120]MVV51976.1 cloacin [Pseudomonas sp. PB120]